MSSPLFELRRWRCQLTALAVTVLVVAMLNSAVSDPQTNLLNMGSSQYNASNLSDFDTNLDAAFTDLRIQLSAKNTWFGTANHTSGSSPVYAMAQCRDYMSTKDCVACYDSAVALIRNSTVANGARVIYDGCFLRHESSSFYDQTTQPGNVGICGNNTAIQPTAFQSAAQGLLTNLQKATPRISGFYAASTMAVAGSSSGAIVYAVAQCAQTVSQSGCQDCLTVAYGNIQSCPPDTDGRAVDAGCFLRYSATAFFGANQTINISPFLQGGRSSRKITLIGWIVSGVGGLLLIIGLILWYHQSRKAKEAPRGTIIGGSALQGAKYFSYKDLKTATKNFSKENKVGGGGFGLVYKGTLKSRNVVAVKKLVMGTTREKNDFKTEVNLISNVHHRNLLRLLGCCTKGPELLLVYDYMANGSLDKFLYGEMRGALNWKQRFDIIFGTAKGLAYLHEEFHVTIIHRDIKCGNILLDKEFQPKIADFGLARLLPEGQSHLSTNFAGTLGYTAPEYAIHGQLTEKVDIYGFGVVVLEIISGRRCNEIKVIEPVTEYLIEQAWNLYENDMHLKLVDEILVDSNGYRDEDAKKIIEIALMCTQTPASSRPTMSEVVVMLSERSTDLQRPSKPTFLDDDKKIRGESSVTVTDSSSLSNATASSMEFTGR